MTDGNGQKTIEQMAEEKEIGTIINLSEIKRQDGLITQAIDDAYAQRLGVIQRAITADSDDKNYRQILKLARWKNIEEMDKAVLAIACCDITGADLVKKIILDKITAHSAGVEAQLLNEAFKALTHTTFTTQHIGDKRWHRANKNSPISG